MVQKLNKYFILLFGILLFFDGCSHKQDEIEANVPEAMFGNEGQNQPISFDDFVTNARYLYEKSHFNDLKKYVSQYKNKYTAEDQKKQISILEALVLMGNKDMARASQNLQSLLEGTNPNIKGQALFYEADLKRLNKDPKGALDFYHKAYDVLKTPEIFSSIADTYSEMRDWSNAEIYYHKVLAVNPESTEDMYDLGMVYFAQNKWDLGEKTFNQVLILNPSSGASYHMLAVIAQKRKDMKNYYYNLSRELLLKRDYASTISLLKEKNEIYEDIRLFEILISSYVRLGNIQEAKNELTKGIQKNPLFNNDINIKIYKGSFLVIPNEGKKAGLTYFTNLYKQYPNNVDVLMAYTGFIEKDKDKQKELEPIYKKILTLEADNNACRYKLAVLYDQENKPSLAQLQYGILYYYQNQKDQALEALLKLKEFYPNFNNSEAYYYIGLIYDEMGDITNARKYYQFSLKINPNGKSKEKLLYLKNKK